MWTTVESRHGLSITRKKNKEQEIISGFLSSICSPLSTYKGPPEAVRTVSLWCVTSEDGTQASGIEENEARTKAYQTQQKNPVNLDETWISILATGVSDAQLKTHW